MNQSETHLTNGMKIVQLEESGSSLNRGAIARLAGLEMLHEEQSVISRQAIYVIP